MQMELGGEAMNEQHGCSVLANERSAHQAFIAHALRKQKKILRRNKKDNITIMILRYSHCPGTANICMCI